MDPPPPPPHTHTRQLLIYHLVIMPSPFFWPLEKTEPLIFQIISEGVRKGMEKMTRQLSEKRFRRNRSSRLKLLSSLLSSCALSAIETHARPKLVCTNDVQIGNDRIFMAFPLSFKTEGCHLKPRYPNYIFKKYFWITEYH